MMKKNLALVFILSTKVLIPGDIILQKTYEIKDSDDYTTLLNLCHKECANLLYESLILFLEDNVKAYKQKEKKRGR